MKKRYADARKQNSQPYYLRELDSVPFASRRIPPAFRRFFREHVQPVLKINGYKREQKAEAAMQAAHALVETALADKVVADSRDTHKAGVRKRVEAWDLLEEAGYCRSCPGSEQSRKVARYRAAQKLIQSQKVWTQALLQSPKEKPTGRLLGLVVFKRKEKGQPSRVPFEEVIRAYAPRDDSGRPDAGSVSTGIAVARVVEEIINAINSENLNHSWKTRKDNGVYFQPNVELVQMHIRQPYRGTRLYTPEITGGQNISKEERRRMKIDGSSVAELDFSASIPRLAYNRRKIDVPADADVYAPDRIAPRAWTTLRAEYREGVRDFIKLATLICFNVPSRSKAVGAIGRELQKWREAKKTSLWNVPNPAELVQSIAFVHKKILPDLFANRGMRLISIEGQIMLAILREFVLGAKKPALPIHDALVVRKEDARFAKQVMKSVYRGVTGFDPVIKVRTF